MLFCERIRPVSFQVRPGTEYPIPTGRSYPESITRGPDGNLWFTTDHQWPEGPRSPLRKPYDAPRKFRGQLATRGTSFLSQPDAWSGSTFTRCARAPGLHRSIWFPGRKGAAGAARRSREARALPGVHPPAGCLSVAPCSGYASASAPARRTGRPGLPLHHRLEKHQQVVLTVWPAQDWQQVPVLSRRRG